MGAIALPLWQRLQPYQQNRLLTFLNPEVDPRAAGYHAIQSKVAIGSGGWFGTGYTQGPQKRLAFLPEQHTDFVFSVVGEELGFVGRDGGAVALPRAVPRPAPDRPAGDRPLQQPGGRSASSDCSSPTSSRTSA